MRITKFDHSCLLVEEGSVRVLTDIGSWNKEMPELSDIDALLVTHEHQDHFDLEKVKAVLAKNPDTVVITHEAVGKLLAESGVAYTKIAPGEVVTVKTVSIESFGTDHAIIYGDKSPCVNTGYLIAGKLFMPGDALHDIPPKPVEILALPTGGPWMKVSEAIDYAKAVKPKTVFPIHDAMYTVDYRQTSVPRWMNNFLAPDIAFVNMMPGDTKDF